MFTFYKKIVYFFKCQLLLNQNDVFEQIFSTKEQGRNKALIFGFLFSLVV
jgi:hypothetical protein